MQKTIRWMLLGCVLLILSIWCMVVPGGVEANGLFQVGYLALPLPSILCFAAGFFRRQGQSALRWMLLGGYLLLAALWCMVFGFMTNMDAYFSTSTIFYVGLAPLSILAVVCFVVGFFRRGE